MHATAISMSIALTPTPSTSTRAGRSPAPTRAARALIVRSYPVPSYRHHPLSLWERVRVGVILRAPSAAEARPDMRTCRPRPPDLPPLDPSPLPTSARRDSFLKPCEKLDGLLA